MSCLKSQETCVLRQQTPWVPRGGAHRGGMPGKSTRVQSVVLSVGNFKTIIKSVKSLSAFYAQHALAILSHVSDKQYSSLTILTSPSVPFSSFHSWSLLPRGRKQAISRAFHFPHPQALPARS